MMRQLPLILALLLIVHPDLKGQEDLTDVESWRCEFPVVANIEWPGDLPRITSETQTFDIQLDNVDLQEGTARLIGNLGATDLMVFPFVTLEQGLGVSLLEFSPTNTVNLITIYPTEIPSSSSGFRPSFKAVTSRHPDIFGPAPSQAYGFCMVWERSG